MRPTLEHHRTVDLNVQLTQNVLAIRLASMRSVETHVLVRAASEHAAMSLTIRQFVHAKPVTLAIHLLTVILNLLHHENRLGPILAIRLHVVPMHNVPMEYALACQNTRVTHTVGADRNVCSIRNVRVIRRVSVANVSILVRERADRMLYVKS